MKVLSAKYENNNHNVIDVLISLDNGNVIPYGFISSIIETDIDKFIDGLIKSGELIPDECDLPILNKDLSRECRLTRNHLLECTDQYLTIPDYPLSDAQKEEIRQYRQALRDITKQEGFPENIIWPPVPECIKNKLPSR